MNKSIVNFLAIFIFNKQKRKAFRKKHIKVPENTRRIAEMQETLKRVEHKQKQAEQNAISIQNQLKNLERELHAQEKESYHLRHVRYAALWAHQPAAQS